MSLSKAMTVDPGFEPRGAVTLSIDPALQNYTMDRRAEFVTRLREAASALPMVTVASVASRVPLSGRIPGTDVMAEGTQTEASATFSSVAPHYFEAMRIDLVRGRDFTASDVSGAPAVAIVNQALARRLWPNADAIGKRFRADGRTQPWREVVGVARDGKYVSLTETPRGAFYLPMAQHPASPVTLVVRTAGDTGELMRGLAGIMRGLDGDMPIFGVQTLEDNIRQVVDRQRAAASLLGVFGTIAVLLAAVGIYGVAAHTVSLRIREIGIRMALGARAASVLWMFVRETLKVTLIGVVLGLTLSAAASQALTAFLFDLRPTDAMTFGAAATIVSLVAVMASYVPARRAARVNPLRALRQD
jgi:predicted permease